MFIAKLQDQDLNFTLTKYFKSSKKYEFPFSFLRTDLEVVTGFGV